jgi:hypothetical protein
LAEITVLVRVANVSISWLTELWGRQTEHTLTHSRYEQIGQLAGAIAQRAEKVIRSLSPLQTSN